MPLAPDLLTLVRAAFEAGSPSFGWNCTLPGDGMASDGLSLGELEAQYPLYCKAMRILVRDGVTINKARRTVCWQKLEILHHCLPRQYREPEQLYLHLQRDQLTAAGSR